MYVIPEFPEDRLEDLKRRAELQVRLQLDGSDAAGVALYEIRADEQSKEVDYAIWFEGIARYAAEVKGGHYYIERGIWYLLTP